MAFLFPPEEIVYSRTERMMRREGCNMGVTANSAVTPTVIVASIALVLNIYNLCMIVIFISCCPTLKFKL